GRKRLPRDGVEKTCGFGPPVGYGGVSNGMRKQETTPPSVTPDATRRFQGHSVGEAARFAWGGWGEASRFAYHHRAPRSAYPADQAFQVARLQAADGDGVIGRLPAAFQDLDFAAFLHRQLGEQVLQHSHRDQAGATASDQKTVALEQPQGQRLQ